MEPLVKAQHSVACPCRGTGEVTVVVCGTVIRWPGDNGYFMQSNRLVPCTYNVLAQGTLPAVEPVTANDEGWDL